MMMMMMMIIIIIIKNIYTIKPQKRVEPKVNESILIFQKVFFKFVF